MNRLSKNKAKSDGRHATSTSGLHIYTLHTNISLITQAPTPTTDKHRKIHTQHTHTHITPQTSHMIPRNTHHTNTHTYHHTIWYTHQTPHTLYTFTTHTQNTHINPIPTTHTSHQTHKHPILYKLHIHTQSLKDTPTHIFTDRHTHTLKGHQRKGSRQTSSCCMSCLSAEVEQRVSLLDAHLHLPWKSIWGAGSSEHKPHISYKPSV